MIKNLIMALAILLPGLLYAQRHDKVWHLGYNWNSDDPIIEASKIVFEHNKPKIEKFERLPVPNYLTNMTFSDSLGNMVYHSNGVVIIDSSYNIVPGSKMVNDTTDQFDYGEGNYLMNALVGLQFKKDQYLLIYPKNIELEGGLTAEIIYSMLLERQQDSLKLVYKHKFILQDSLTYGNFQACKHANGRDWWITFMKFKSNVFYSILVTPDTIYPPKQQAIGKIREADAGGQGKFSPKGTHFAFASIECGLNLYDFNRVTGKYSNPRYFKYPNSIPDYSSGLSFSPDGRFLYFCNALEMYQVDLNGANDSIVPELIAGYDGFKDPIFGETLFLHSQLAPDGKIYWGTGPTSRFLHVTNYPNKQGKSCGFTQHSVQLPNFNDLGMPSWPNYRLGPIDGSPADTLGIDNIPVANFRADQDSLNFLDLQFQDLSYYEPATWSWDFGDGTMSSDTSPVHTYPKKGTYIVCLTVSNVNGSNTICDTLKIGTSATESQNQTEISVYPNPAKNHVLFIMNDYYPQHGRINLYDNLGRLQKSKKMNQGWNNLEVQDLPRGVYYYEVVDDGRQLYSGKLLLVE